MPTFASGAVIQRAQATSLHGRPYAFGKLKPTKEARLLLDTSLKLKRCKGLAYSKKRLHRGQEPSPCREPTAPYCFGLSLLSNLAFHHVSLLFPALKPKFHFFDLEPLLSRDRANRQTSGIEAERDISSIRSAKKCLATTETAVLLCSSCDRLLLDQMIGESSWSGHGAIIFAAAF